MARTPDSDQPAQEIIGPVSSYYISQRLKLHYVDWGNEDKPPLLLVHGGRDHARSWDWVARALRDDYHVIAPDLRGHGDSSWAMGGHYTIAEFVLDIAQLIETLDVAPLTLVGHSLGGTVCVHYAGVYPERVSKLVSIEGLGPPPGLAEVLNTQPMWERTRKWVDQVREFSARHPRRYPTIEEAAARMQRENSFLCAEQALHLTRHGVARNEDASFSWKFDNYVRILYPQRYPPEIARALWERIDCPTLLISGEQSGFGDPEEDGRLSAFRNARLERVQDAGHWVHHDQLDVFLGLMGEFAAE